MNIIGDMHTHTLASTHAYSTITENCRSAAERGIKVVAMTDHWGEMPDSPHIWHFENLRVLPRHICGVTVLRGVETNIKNDDGEVDMPRKTLEKLEWVVASMHRQVYTPSTVENHTRAYLKVAEDPIVDVIGHCTTSIFPIDFEKCIKKFKECGKLVEINESSILYKSGSFENSYEVLRLCKKYEVPVVFDSDAHYCDLIGVVDTAQKIAQEVGFPERLVINADHERLAEYIHRKHPEIEFL
ncbi:MAG: phosphatase [Ruminococcus sp.]|nr:phosphatase [Ruminococcus sp.]